MKRIFKEYGGVITAAIAIVLLISIVTLTVGGPNGGWIGSAFNSVVSEFQEKAGSKIDAGANTTPGETPSEPTNLFEGNSWTYGKYLNGSTGNVSTGAANSITDFIEVAPNQSYALQCEVPTDKNLILQAYYYDADMKYITEVGKVTVGRSAIGSWAFTTPENTNVKYLRFGLYFSGADETILVPTSTKLFACSDLVSNGVALAGKSLLNFGDSIAQGAGGVPYANQIAAKNYMKLTNNAVGGATIRVVENSTNNILAQIENTDSSLSPDFVLLEGLTNDAYEGVVDDAAVLGVISEGFSISLDTTTFCGAFETILKTTKEKWPDAKVIYVTPHINSSRDYDCQNTLVELSIEMCEKWGITIADVYHDSGFDTINNIDHQNTYIADGSHPNTLGYKTFYVPLIEAKMKSLID